MLSRSPRWSGWILRPDGQTGDRNHGLRDEAMRSVHRVGDRCAEELIEYEYEYEYRTHRRTEYEYDGSRVSVGQNVGHHPARASKVRMLKTADRVLGVHGFVRPL